MKKILLGIGVVIGITISFSSCDAVVESNGMILDKDTKLPLDSVAIGMYEIEDSSKNYTLHEYSDEHGDYKYHRISSSNTFDLYFIKKGYKTKKKELHTTFGMVDTIYMERIHR